MPPLTTQGPVPPALVNQSAAFSVNEPDRDSVFRQQFPQLPARHKLRLGPKVPLAHHLSRIALLLELFHDGDLVRMKAQVAVGPSIRIDSHVEPGALGLSRCQKHRTRRRTDRGCGVEIGEHYPFNSETVKVSRFSRLRPVAVDV